MLCLYSLYIDATLHHHAPPNLTWMLSRLGSHLTWLPCSKCFPTSTRENHHTQCDFWHWHQDLYQLANDVSVFFARSIYNPPEILTQRDYSPFLCDSVILSGCCEDELGGIVTEVEPLNDHCHSRDLWPFMVLFWISSNHGSVEDGLSLRGGHFLRYYFFYPLNHYGRNVTVSTNLF